MAPVTSKRRRGEDEPRRPKKKVKHVKKQKEYHSGSEDESADEKEALPIVRPAEEDLSKANAIEVAPRQPKPEIAAVASQNSQPKPILKRKAAAAAVVTPREDLLEADEDIDELERNTALNAAPASASCDGDDDDDDADNDEDVLPEDDMGEASSAEDSEADSDEESLTSTTASSTARTKKKRNDPTAFATSITRILDTKLTTTKRQDPVLSRSASAAEANMTLADEKLSMKARAQIRSERRNNLEKGRVKDVLGLQTAERETGKVLEQEKRLKKTAQRGVVKLFNAVRAAQVKGEEAMKAARSEGVVGMKQREERVNEMSKQGFLDLISSGGKQGVEA